MNDVDLVVKCWIDLAKDLKEKHVDKYLPKKTDLLSNLVRSNIVLHNFPEVNKIPFEDFKIVYDYFEGYVLTNRYTEFKIVISDDFFWENFIDFKVEDIINSYESLQLIIPLSVKIDLYRNETFRLYLELNGNSKTLFENWIDTVNISLGVELEPYCKNFDLTMIPFDLLDILRNLSFEFSNMNIDNIKDYTERMAILFEKTIHFDRNDSTNLRRDQWNMFHYIIALSNILRLQICSSIEKEVELHYQRCLRSRIPSI